MKILLVNIHSLTTTEDIVEFVNKAIQSPFSFKQSSIESVEIMLYYDENLKHPRFYLFVCIASENLARKAISKLNRKMLRGKRVGVREFVVRNPLNDRRDPHAIKYPSFLSRRSGDRRKKTLNL